MFAENTDYEILTPDGWKDFRGITLTENKITSTVILDNDTLISATDNHYFFLDGQKIQLKDIVVGSKMDTVDGKATVLSIERNEEECVYDIVEVPGAIPVTTPVALTVATPVLTLLQTPPIVPSVKLVVVVGQTVNVPVIVPAFGVALTVTTAVAAAMPQLLVTV